MRSIFLAVALVAAGAGFARLTGMSPRPGTASQAVAPAPVAASDSVAGRFHLLLSDPARRVWISSGTDETEAAGDEPAGILRFDPENPQVALVVEWTDEPAPGEHRFAKLTLELPGRPTFIHTFDAAGDIDDFAELPLP